MSQMVSLFIDTAPETMSGVRHVAPKKHPRRAEKPWRAPFVRLKNPAVAAFKAEVRALWQTGMSVSDIARCVGKDRATVRHHLKGSR
jgi:hypothetical protein